MCIDIIYLIFKLSKIPGQTRNSINFIQNKGPQIKLHRKISFKDYFLPLYCLEKKNKLKYLLNFIKIYHFKLSVENILELIFKTDYLGKNLEEMKIIEFNKIPTIEELYQEANITKSSKVSKFSLNINNSRMQIFEQEEKSPNQ